MTNEEKLIEIERLMGLYYSTKRQCNHTTDIVQTSQTWDRASKYWDEAHKLKESMKET